MSGLSLIFDTPLHTLTPSPNSCSGWDSNGQFYFPTMDQAGWGVGNPPSSDNIIMTGLTFYWNADGVNRLDMFHGLKFDSSLAVQSVPVQWGNDDGSSPVTWIQPSSAGSENHYGVCSIGGWHDGCKTRRMSITWSNIYNPRDRITLSDGADIGNGEFYSLDAPLGTFITSLHACWAASEGGGNGFGSFLNGGISTSIPLKISGDHSQLTKSPFLDLVENCSKGNWIFSNIDGTTNLNVNFKKSTPKEPTVNANNSVYSDYLDSSGNVFWYDMYAISTPDITAISIYGNISIDPGNTGILAVCYGAPPSTGSLPTNEYITSVGSKWLVYQGWTLSIDQSSCTAAGCTSDSNCPNSSTPACNITTGICVQCTDTNHNQCINTQTCINNICVASAACTMSSECQAPTPFCNTTLDVCVQCLKNTDCASNYCGSNGTCQSAPSSCVTSKDCAPGSTCINGVCITSNNNSKGKSYTWVYIVVGIAIFLIILFFVIKKLRSH